MAMLTAENLNVYYGMIHALKDVSFHVDEGEIVALIGANGAGKTTTLHTISGMLQAKSGSVQFEGREIVKMPGHQIVSLGMSHVPEGRRVFAGLTVYENLKMGAYTRKDKNEIAETLEMVYTRFPRLKERTRQLAGTLKDAVAGADVFIGVSAGNIFSAEDVATMADRAVVFAMANPTPEIDPAEAVKHAEVVATGRSDFANQINNVLAFPGVFRGLLDAHATRVSDRMLLAAANALADVVSAEELNPTYIVPSVFHDGVTKAVASAVEQVAREEAGTIDTITGTMTAVYADEITLNG